MSRRFANAGTRAGLTCLLLCLAVLGEARAWGPSIVLDQADASFLGEGSVDLSGYWIDGLGDVNGDGYADFGIGAQTQNLSYLVLGHATGWQVDTELGSADGSFAGEQSGDFAFRIAGAGDLDNDELDDIVISARHNDENGNDAGQVYVVFGHSEGWALDASLAEADASYLGEAAENYAGYDLDGAGDVNGDGFDDLIIGAYGNSENGTGAGQVYLVFGRAGGWTMDVDLSTVDASFHGEWPMDYAGTSVGGAGDVDGDGFDDVLAAAPYNNDGGSWAGKVYLIAGRSSGWELDASLADADSTLLGDYLDGIGLFGDVCAAGDVNGDGLGDVIIAEPLNDFGPVLLFGSQGFWGNDTFLYDAGTTMWPAEGSNSAGYSSAALGDVNGDGFDDFSVGDPGYPVPSWEGTTYVIMGRAGPWPSSVEMTDASSAFQGEVADDRAGMATAGAGDVNGDGFDDLIIGAPWNDEADGSAGQTYLILGHPCSDTDGDGYEDCAGDCDDSDPLLTPEDEDGDGHSTCDGDCDDSDADRYPGATEICNGIDDDCDGMVPDDEVDGDGDGHLACEDCDDTDAAVHPDRPEDCHDGIDNDCDGDVDLADDECDDPPDDDDSASDDDTDDDSTDDDTTPPDCECVLDTEGGTGLAPLFLLAAALLGRLIRRR